MARPAPDLLAAPPPSFRDLERLPVAQTRICDVAAIDQEVTRLFYRIALHRWAGVFTFQVGIFSEGL